jgi:hypothetical protein
MITKKELIDTFAKWFANDPHALNEDFYLDTINKDNINGLTERELIEFFTEFAISGGKIQSGGARTAGKLGESITENYAEFRLKILEPFREDFILENWLKWAERFKYLGQGTASIFLNRVDKKKFVVVNEKSIDGLLKLGFPAITGNLLKKYKAVEAAEQSLLNEFPQLQNYYRVDALMHYIIGTDEGREITKEGIAEDYFNLDGFNLYVHDFGKEYDEKSPAANWFKDTRLKLEYMVQVLKTRLEENISINYSERPRGMAGPGIFVLKNYVLSGFSPDNLFPDGELFIKLAFHELGKSPTFDIELDINYKLENKPFKDEIEEIKVSTRKRIPVNYDFPKDWDTLILAVQDHVKYLIEEFRKMAQRKSLTILTETRSATPVLTPPKMNPLNIILYGPPGTGKTYHMLEMIEKMRLIESEVGPQPLEPFVNNIKWWQVIALALIEFKNAKVGVLQNHELIQAKFRTSNVKNRGARIWSTLQIHTVVDCPNVEYANRNGIQLFYKEADSTWRLNNIDETKEVLSDLVYSYNVLKRDFKNDGIVKKKYSFITCHQSLGYEDFIEGIKPIMVSEMEDDNDVLSYEVKSGLFYKACEQAASLAGYENLEACLADSKEGRAAKFAEARNNKNLFVFFMDEINRCNVASVFGELITLIEADKRLGALHEIADIELPYSKKKFGVPLNLMIVGTMNTADRSVESLDTALRRRFDFDPKLPNPELLKDNMKEINLSDLLKKINLRLETLLDKDHTIGHAWFWDVKDLNGLRSVFSNKILPLLQEYFYNDYEKIALILGDKFVKEQIISGHVFAKSIIGKDQSSEYDGKKLFTLNPLESMSIEDFNSIL